MTKLRSTLILGLAAAFIMLTQSMAFARGQAPAVDQVVICSGGAVLTVAVDENGQPVGPPHICPDCALMMMALAVPPNTIPAQNTVFQTARWSVHSSVFHNPVRQNMVQARAPPAAA